MYFLDLNKIQENDLSEIQRVVLFTVIYRLWFLIFLTEEKVSYLIKKEES